MTQATIGGLLYETLQEVKADSRRFMEAGVEHDNPEFLWIGKGMNYAMEKIEKTLTDYMTKQESAARALTSSHSS